MPERENPLEGAGGKPGISRNPPQPLPLLPPGSVSPRAGGELNEVG